MKIKLFSITLLFFLSTPTWSQTSLEAKDLLEKASKKLDKYVSFEIEFIYVLNTVYTFIYISYTFKINMKITMRFKISVFKY